MPARHFIALGLAALVSTAGLAFGQVDPAAKEKMEKMAAAVKNAKSISYKVEFKGEGGFMAMLPVTTLDVVLERSPDQPTLWRSRMTGRRAEVQGPGGLPALNIKLISDGTKTTWIDEPTKTVMERFSAGANSDQSMSAALAALRELTESEPFSKELAAPTMTAEASAKADGVDCDVVLVDLGAGQSQSRWYIGPDGLPRRLERMMAGVGTQLWTLSEVKLNPAVPEGSFVMSKPEGYAFSPAVTTPPPAQPTAEAPVTKPAPRERALGVNLGDLAPDFELSDPAGEKVKLSSLKGNVVVLDFWGTWCLPCKKASPEMQKLVTAFKDKPVKLYGLSVRESSDDKPIAYMKDNNYTYGLLLKADEVAKQYRVKVFPTYFVVAQDGEIVFVTSGFNDETFPRITTAIQQALNGGPGAAGTPGTTTTVPGAGTTDTKTVAPKGGGSDDKGSPAKGADGSADR